MRSTSKPRRYCQGAGSSSSGTCVCANFPMTWRCSGTSRTSHPHRTCPAPFTGNMLLPATRPTAVRSIFTLTTMRFPLLAQHISSTHFLLGSVLPSKCSGLVKGDNWTGKGPHVTVPLYVRTALEEQAPGSFAGASVTSRGVGRKNARRCTGLSADKGSGCPTAGAYRPAQTYVNVLPVNPPPCPSMRVCVYPGVRLFHYMGTSPLPWGVHGDRKWGKGGATGTICLARARHTDMLSLPLRRRQ